MTIKDSSKQYLLSYLSDIKTDSKDNIYLFDVLKPKVIKLNKNGEYINTIIKNGRGPGEIQSIYAAFLNKKTNSILIGDRQNERLMVTDLQGKEQEELVMSPYTMNTPEGIEHYYGDEYVFLFSLGEQQTLRKEKGVDSYFHIFDLKKKKLLSSFGDRTFILNKLHYTKGAALNTSFNIGDVMFPDHTTFIYAPYVYDGKMLKFTRADNGKWTFTSEITGRNWQRPAFKDLTFYQDRTKYKTGRNVIRTISPAGEFAGLFNIRSAGLFRLNKSTIIHFAVTERETKSGDSFYQTLYAELFDNDLNFIGSDKINQFKKGTIIIKVGAKDADDNFFMALKNGQYHTQGIKFSLRIEHMP